MKKLFIIMLLATVATSVSAQNSKKYDVNGDGSVDVSDITSIATYILKGEEEEHEYVDLGLPSGTLWATCNIGAESPEDYGDYFAWGETEPYYTLQDPLTWKDGKSSGYRWASYKYCNGSETTMTKYCTQSKYGTVDNKTVLEAEDDAATADWGSDWRMPTIDEFSELINSSYTTTTWTTQGGVNGYLITSKVNSNSIFLPAAGWRDKTSLNYAGTYGYYWSSSLFSSSSSSARGLTFSSSDVSTSNRSRFSGRSVRPVRCSASEF